MRNNRLKKSDENELRREITRRSISWLRQPLTGCLVILMVAPYAKAGTPLPPQELAVQRAGAAPSPQPQAQTPDNTLQADDTLPPASLPDNPPPMSSQADNQSQQSSQQQSTPPPQDKNQVPVGAAAAPNLKALGVPASRPAGAAIAPAKQRRTRSIFIKVGLIVAAGVAIGVVAAAANGSPSRAN